MRNERKFSVQDCFASFSMHIHSAYPIIKPVDLVVAESIIDAEEADTDQTQQPSTIQRAEALLVYALGECCCDMAKGGHGVDAHSREIFEKAIRILDTVRTAEANILLALRSFLVGRCGKECASAICRAGQMLAQSAELKFAHLRTPGYLKATNVHGSAENQFLVLCWTFFMMARLVASIALVLLH